jgi:hypothetical protein
MMGFAYWWVADCAPVLALDSFGVLGRDEQASLPVGVLEPVAV